MGGGQRGGVVQPVAHHQHLRAVAGEVRHQRRLLLRQGLGDDLLDADARGEGLHRAARVARQEDHAPPGAFSAATVSAAPSRSVSVKRIARGASSPIFRKVAVTSGASAPSHAARPSRTLCPRHVPSTP
jgi:hypothetical protein